MKKFFYKFCSKLMQFFLTLKIVLIKNVHLIKKIFTENLLPRNSCYKEVISVKSKNNESSENVTHRFKISDKFDNTFFEGFLPDIADIIKDGISDLDIDCEKNSPKNVAWAKKVADFLFELQNTLKATGEIEDSKILEIESILKNELLNQNFELLDSKNFDKSIQRVVEVENSENYFEPKVLKIFSYGLKQENVLIRKQEIRLGIFNNNK